MNKNSGDSSLFGGVMKFKALLAMVILAGLALGACSSSGTTTSASTATTVSGSCTGVPGKSHARVVVEVDSSKIVERCVGFSGSSIPATKLLTESKIEIGTQTYSSLGLALCQVDNVPAHYSKCFSSTGNYWATFLSTDGHTWTSPSVGISSILVPAGGSLGLRYDPQTGTPAAPVGPTPAA
jgi:hypothetical protein